MKTSGTKDQLPADRRHGIQSVEVAAPLLFALTNADGPLSLSSLAFAAGMPAAKAHRYLVSFIRTGLVEQDPASGLYDLGPAALDIGLAAIGRLDAVKLAGDTLHSLRDATGETVALAAWGNFGPTYVRLLASRGPVTVNLRIGSVMPLTYTASGLCFAAFMENSDTAPLLEREFASNRRLGAPSSRKALEPLLEEVRRHGMARVIGRLDPASARMPSPGRVAGRLLAGFNAFSAPVFDHDGAMRFALTVVGSAAHIDPSWDGTIARQTQRHAQALSRRLGYRALPAA